MNRLTYLYLYDESIRSVIESAVKTYLVQHVYGSRGWYQTSNEIENYLLVEILDENDAHKGVDWSNTYDEANIEYLLKKYSNEESE